MQLAVAGAHAAGFDALDAVGDQLGIRMLDRLVVVGRVDQALAGGAVGGAQLLAQYRIADAVLQVVAGDGFDFEDFRRVGVEHRIGEALDVGQVGFFVLHALEQGAVGAEGGLLLLAERQVFHREDPLRGALEVLELAGAGGQRGDDLHAGGTVADDADAPAIQRNAVIPAGAVQQVALEAVQAADVRSVGVVQHAGGGDDDVRAVAQAALHLQLPAAVDEFAADDFLVEADQLVDPILLHRALEILLDFRARWQEAAPVGVGLEGVGVGVRGHVAGQAGVGVLAPGAADARGLLVDGHVTEAGLAQLDAAQNAGHAGAHHHHPQIGSCCCAVHGHTFLLLGATNLGGCGWANMTGPG
ncbi:hypothetical protein D9M71_383940 [compost metagenome]